MTGWNWAAAGCLVLIHYTLAASFVSFTHLGNFLHECVWVCIFLYFIHLMPKTIIKIQVQDSAIHTHICIAKHATTHTRTHTRAHIYRLTSLQWQPRSVGSSKGERARKKEPTTTTWVAYRQRQARSEKRKTTKRRSNCRCNACTRTPHQPTYALPLAPTRTYLRLTVRSCLCQREVQAEQRHMARLLKSKERQKIAANWRERNRLQLKIEQKQHRRQQQ